MNIWNGIGDYPEERERVVATIGNFDGVHLGHRRILDRAVAEASSRGLASLLITFEPHPIAVVAPDRRPDLLQTRRQKLDCLERLGLTDVLFLHFDAELAALEGTDFFERFLCPRVGLAAVHVGENFRFGRGRAGDLQLLCRIGERAGFEVLGVPPVQLGDQTVSSSAIRAAVSGGDVERGADLLGRPFSLTGEVVRGAGRGRSLDFPTANLDVDNEILPGGGVYVSEVLALAGRHPAMTNVGVRPTFGGKNEHVESHLFDFDGDLYGERIEVRFLARIRDEAEFPSPAELSDQIARDRAAAEAFFRNLTYQAP